MSRDSLQPDHPVDALPEYVRGVAREAESIERHLAQCEDCRVELEVLRALYASGPEPLTDVERQRVYRAFEGRRAVGTGGDAGRRRWMTVTWRVAAGIAVLLTSVGVWQVVETGRAGDWSPELAIEGWEEELADLDLAPGEVRMAFGPGVVDEVAWEDLEGLDPYDLVAPWEDDR